MGVYKLSTAGGLATPRTNYSSFLAGNPAVSFAAYESIATVTVGSGGVSGVTFSSIPSTYTHLQIRAMGKSSYAGSGAPDFLNLSIKFNSDADSNNYSTHNLIGNGSSASASGSANNIGQAWRVPQSGDNGWAVGVMDILDYANTNKYKTYRFLTGFDNNGSGAVRLISMGWRNTAAITSITFPGEPLWVQYSSFALYGIKGA
jgi:hypothetical protein